MTLAGLRSRSPIWIFLAGLAALYLSLPHAELDGDVATFGLMGEDLLRYGHGPTLMIGQNYLFSPTPWLYAFWRVLLPDGTPHAVALTMAGLVLTLGGMAFVLEGFRRVQARLGAGLIWPTACFVLLLAGNVPFIMDHAKSSGVEISLFLLGVLLLSGSRIESAITGSAEPRRATPGAWLALGAATGFAVISRPPVVFYGLPLAALLLGSACRRSGLRAAVWPLILLAAGLGLGYLPMAVHRLARAPDWPFAARISLTMGTWEQVAASVRTTFGDILPVVFGVRPEMALKPLRYLVWAALAGPGYAWAVWKRPVRVSMLDHALLLGSLAILGALCLAPDLSLNQEQRRYGLSLFVTGVWLGCRFVPAPGWRNGVALAVCLALLGVSAPRWKERLEKAAVRERRMREARSRLVPELAARGAPLLANYWDAALLQFLAEGRLRIESYPWGCVRTYGLIPRDAMERRSLWLIVEGTGRETVARLRQEGGPDVAERAIRTKVQNRLLGKSCEIWELPDPQLASRLMLRYHPLYFRTPYPPGSGPIRPPE